MKTTSGPKVGDPNDPNFLAVQDLAKGGEVENSWGRSLDLAHELLEQEFGWARTWPPEVLAHAAHDPVIDSMAYSWTGASSWHVWYVKYSTTGNSGRIQGWGTDSLQIWALGFPQSYAGVDSLINILEVDSIKIRAHHFWRGVDSTCLSGRHDHALRFNRIHAPWLDNFVMNGTVRDGYWRDMGCLPDSCRVTMNTDAQFSGVVLPVAGFKLRLQDCPIAGSATVRATVDLECIGSAPSPLKQLQIDGIWDMTLVVEQAKEIKFTVTNGVSAWSFTETCTWDGF